MRRFSALTSIKSNSRLLFYSPASEVKSVRELSKWYCPIAFLEVVLIFNRRRGIYRCGAGIYSPEKIKPGISPKGEVAKILIKLQFICNDFSSFFFLTKSFFNPKLYQILQPKSSSTLALQWLHQDQKQMIGVTKSRTGLYRVEEYIV